MGETLGSIIRPLTYYSYKHAYKVELHRDKNPKVIWSLGALRASYVSLLGLCDSYVVHGTSTERIMK